MTPPPPAIRARPAAAGFTLVELLVAATAALAVMAALVGLFGAFSRAVSAGREISQMTARMRSAAWRLRQDLQGLTTEVKPWVRPEAAAGYFELVEGPLRDSGTATVTDIDDVLMFTTASPGRPFTGMIGGGGFESPCAEVAWFCKASRSGQSFNNQPLYDLYRRQLLVSAVPGAGGFPAANSMTFSSWDAYFLENDVSCRRRGVQLLPNGLTDLTARENRFMHNAAGVVSAAAFPYVETFTTGSAAADGEILTGAREGEDLVLANVLAFDVRVFNPGLATAAGSAAYWDLGGGSGSAPLSGVMDAKVATKLGGPGTVTYDTWSMHYEFNGIDDDGSNGVDQGTNGIDDNGDNVVDDLEEFETAPPYGVPLRGVEIRIRCIEPTSQEVRQITIQHSFRAR